MKTWILLFCSLCTASAALGQSWQKMESREVFDRRLNETAANTHSIDCDFIQEKYLDVFAEKILSKGKFYFRKENKIALCYTQPLDYLIVIDGQKLKTVSEGKTNVVDLSSNKMMDGMNRLLAACMTGNLGLLQEGYRMEFLEDPAYYLVRIRPQQEALKSYIREMALWFDKKDMAVVRLRLSENESDYTEYQFLNRQFNTLHDDEKFTIR